MKRPLVILLLALAVPCLAFGQATPRKTAPKVGSTAQVQTPPVKPGPEHKKLEIWVGNITYEGEYKATPLGPAGPFKGKNSVRPILGGFFVEFRGREAGPAGTTQWAEIDGYDPVTKHFTWNFFDSSGGFQTGTYTIEGTTVSFSGTQQAGGKQARIRGTDVFAADFMSWVDRREVSLDGKTWLALAESRITKVK